MLLLLIIPDEDRKCRLMDWAKKCLCRNERSESELPLLEEDNQTAVNNLKLNPAWQENPDWIEILEDDNREPALELTEICKT